MFGLKMPIHNYFPLNREQYQRDHQEAHPRVETCHMTTLLKPLYDTIQDNTSSYMCSLLYRPIIRLLMRVPHMLCQTVADIQ